RQLRHALPGPDLPQGSDEQPGPAGGPADCRDRARLRPGRAGHRRRQFARRDPRRARRGLLPHRELLPVRDPGRRGGHPVRVHLLALRRPAQRHAGARGAGPRDRLARGPGLRPRGDHPGGGVEPAGLLHGALRGRHPFDPGGDRRGRASGRLRPPAAVGAGHHAHDPGERLDGRGVHGDRRAGHVRVRPGDGTQRRDRQERRGHLPLPLPDRVLRLAVRTGLGDGCGAGTGDDADGRDRPVRLPTEGRDAMSSAPDTSTTSTSASDPGPGRRREGTSPQRLSGGDRAFGAVSTTILTIWALLVVLPLLWTFYSSFKNSREILTSPFSLPAELSVENFVNAWTEAGIGRFFGNTLIVVGGALFLVMLLGAMCAYVLARYSFPGRRLIY